MKKLVFQQKLIDLFTIKVVLVAKTASTECIGNVMLVFPIVIEVFEKICNI